MPEGSHIDVFLKQTKDSAKNWKQDCHSRAPSSWLLKSLNELEENLDFRLQILLLLTNKQMSLLNWKLMDTG
jgi:hypothetical protein